MDFNYKVITPSITYGILIWGSVGKSIFDELERIHTRAARILYGLAWDTLSQTIQESVKWKPLKPFLSFEIIKLSF